MNIFFDSFELSQGDPEGSNTTDGSFEPFPYRSNGGVTIESEHVIFDNQTDGQIVLDYLLPDGQYFDPNTIQSITFSNCYCSSGGVEDGNTTSALVFVNDDNGDTLGVGETSTLGTIGSGQNLFIDCSGNTGFPLTTYIQFIFQLNTTSEDFVQVFLGAFTSVVTCVARGSKIELKDGGKKKIEKLHRGDEVKGGKVAALIKQPLHPRQRVEIISIPSGALGVNQPSQTTLLCSQHYLIYEGKRRLAKSLLAFPGVKRLEGRAADILPLNKEGQAYLYDIQFEDEGSYWVNGLESQSRSPFAQISPLAKELYFTPEKYREIRVPNTLTTEPPITFNYLLPDGEEAESFAKVEKRI